MLPEEISLPEKSSTDNLTGIICYENNAKFNMQQLEKMTNIKRSYWAENCFACVFNFTIMFLNF